MKRTVTVFTDVQVEVDLTKFPTSVLFDEIKERGEDELTRKINRIKEEHEREMEEAGSLREDWHHIPRLSSPDQHPLHGIYYAMKFGKQEHAIDLMRDYLADLFGVCL